jgi:hypothetical protein
MSDHRDIEEALLAGTLTIGKHGVAEPYRYGYIDDEGAWRPRREIVDRPRYRTYTEVRDGVVRRIAHFPLTRVEPPPEMREIGERLNRAIREATRQIDLFGQAVIELPIPVNFVRNTVSLRLPDDDQE